MRINLEKMPVSLIGLIQAAAVSIYIVMIVFVLQIISHSSLNGNEFAAGVLMLSLLVFSAATTGAIVLGYCIYELINQRVKRAISVFLHTLLFLLIMAIGIICVGVLIGK